MGRAIWCAGAAMMGGIFGLLLGATIRIVLRRAVGRYTELATTGPFWDGVAVLLPLDNTDTPTAYDVP